MMCITLTPIALLCNGGERTCQPAYLEQLMHLRPSQYGNHSIIRPMGLQLSMFTLRYGGVSHQVELPNGHVERSDSHEGF